MNQYFEGIFEKIEKKIEAECERLGEVLSWQQLHVKNLAV